MQAKNGNKEWNISFNDFQKLITTPCYYCKNNLGSLSKNCGSGLDRINNDKGYTLDNVIPCCYVCNSRRNKYLTIEENKIAAMVIIKIRLDKG